MGEGAALLEARHYGGDTLVLPRPAGALQKRRDAAGLPEPPHRQPQPAAARGKGPDRPDADVRLHCQIHRLRLLALAGVGILVGCRRDRLHQDAKVTESLARAVARKHIVEGVEEYPGVRMRTLSGRIDVVFEQHLPGGNAAQRGVRRLRGREQPDNARRGRFRAVG